MFGSVFIGVFLGVAFAWIENLTARKLVMSMEGFLSLCLLMNLMNSFEMVASVLVTAIFQSFVIVVAASAPFVRRTTSSSSRQFGSWKAMTKAPKPHPSRTSKIVGIITLGWSNSPSGRSKLRRGMSALARRFLRLRSRPYPMSNT